MISSNNLTERAYNKFVGEIPQVYSHFIHHFGEDRVDLTLDGNTFNYKSYLGMVEELKRLKEKIPLEFTTIYSKFILDKVEQFLNEVNLDFNNEFIEEASVEEFTEILNNIIEHYFKIDFDYKIIVHFPEIKITNDNNNSIKIYDMYCHIPLRTDGTLVGDIGFCKTTYTEAQWNSYYIHSHMPSLKEDSPFELKYACYGSGPLAHTTLALRIDSNINLWPLFCLELERYLQVESLKGGPYNKLENVINKSVKKTINRYQFEYDLLSEFLLEISVEFELRAILKEFIKYIIKLECIPFVFDGSKYNIGINFKDASILLTNVFLDFFNKFYYKEEHFTHSKIISLFEQCTIKGDSIEYRDGTAFIQSDINIAPFSFKGNPVILKFKKEIDNIENTVYILSPTIINNLIYALLIFINHGQQYKKIPIR